MPATDKYFYKRKKGHMAGYLDHQCRLCRLWGRMPGVPLTDRGWLKIQDVQPFFIEGVNRVGLVEFARRVGVTRVNMRLIINGSRKNVSRKVAKNAMLELVSMRRKGEVRHRDSIRHGAEQRGRVEKVVRTKNDYYNQHNDKDTDDKKVYLRLLDPAKKADLRKRDVERKRRQRDSQRMTQG